MKANNEKLYFHASSVGNLKTGGYLLWSEKDQLLLDEMRSRKAGTLIGGHGRALKLSKTNRDDYIRLMFKWRHYHKVIVNGGTNLQLGQTAKSYLEDLWRFLNFGFKEPMMSKEVMKGMMTEQDCIELVDDVFPTDGFRSPTTSDDRVKDDMFNGLKDVNYSMPVDFFGGYKISLVIKTIHEG